MIYSITKQGNQLDKTLYSFDENTLVFSSEETDLVLDFSLVDGVTFNTGSNCTFKTGYYCTFNTGSNCTFKTSSNCLFNTSSYCTFNTSYECTFKTGSFCTFNTGSNCTFKTDVECMIITSVNSSHTLVENVVVMLISINKTKVFNLNDYYTKDLEGFIILTDELCKIKEFPLDEPRLLMLHINDELGKRLFEHYKNKGLL